MKIRLLAAAVAFGTVLALSSSCARPVEGYTSAQGSVGASSDDALVFAADTDTDQVYVFDTVSEQRVAAVKVGASPEKVLVAKDDTLFVTNRMGRSISVIRRGDWREAARLDVGVEPVSMALAGDGKTLYVVSATSLQSAEYGVLTAIDVPTLSTKWELPVGHEPRGLALLDGNRAVVSLFKDGDVALVDLSGPKLLKGSTDLFQKLNTSILQGGTRGDTGAGGSLGPLPPEEVGGAGGGSGFFNFSAPTSRARGVGALAVSPDGHHIYAAARLSSDALLSAGSGTAVECTDARCKDQQFPDSSGGGSGYGGGRCGATSVSAPALLTFDRNASPLVSDVADCSLQVADRPPMLLNSGNSTIPIQGPTAAVVDPTGAFVYVVNHDSNNVAIVNTTQRPSEAQGGAVATDLTGGAGSARPNFEKFGIASVKSVVSVGAGPTGIALARDGLRAWVYNSLDHSISLIKSSREGVLRTVKTVELGKDVLAEDVVIGRKLFFNANDSRMNSLGNGITCGTCHLDGREDGHVWNFTTGPRQTPTLAGRMLAQTQPLHWDGEFAGMSDLSQAITRRMGGHDLTPAMATQLSAYLASLPSADNPHLLQTRTEAQLRGAQVFSKANCASCHTRETLTDNGFAHVGTLVTTGAVRDNPKSLPNGFNTPSLLGLARTAPYLHDGSALTLKARILQGKDADLHGKTSQLTPAEVDDLVAYLQTL